MSGLRRTSSLQRMQPNNGTNAQNASSPVVPTSQEAEFWSREQADLFEKWASSFEKYNHSYSHPYFDYFYTGQDIQVILEGLSDPEDILPIYSFGYILEQQKMPVYGYWDYCVDDKTEAFTKRGWLRHDEITEDDTILSMDKDGELKWSSILSIYRNHDFHGKMHKLSGRNSIDALVTPGHKFALDSGKLVPVEEIKSSDSIRFMGEAVSDSLTLYSEAVVDLVGAFFLYGSVNKDFGNIVLSMPNEVDLQLMQKIFTYHNLSFIDYVSSNGFEIVFSKENADLIPVMEAHIVDGNITQEFLVNINTSQRSRLLEMIEPNIPSLHESSYETVQSLAALLGITSKVSKGYFDKKTKIQLTNRKTTKCSDLVFPGLKNKKVNEPTEVYDGTVWCPETEYGTFVCRRNKLVYVTGNTYSGMLRGTRIVSGAFSMVSLKPHFLTTKIAKAAEIRSKTHKYRNTFQQLYGLNGLDEDEALIQHYWLKHYDNNLASRQQHLFSVHPPFNLLIKYGLQETSLSTNSPSHRVDEFREKFGNDSAMATDYNERLVKNPSEDEDFQVLLENVEVTNKTVQYDTEGNPILETYTFIARDERLLDPSVYRAKPLPSPNQAPSGGGGGNSVLYR